MTDSTGCRTGPTVDPWPQSGITVLKVYWLKLIQAIYRSHPALQPEASTMTRPRIKRTTEQIEAPNGDLYLMRPSAGTDIQIENPDTEGRQLLEALDGSYKRDELEERFGREAVNDLLAQLEELGLVEDAADDDLIPSAITERFDRQIRYFADITTGPTPSQCQARLESARLVVLGV